MVLPVWCKICPNESSYVIQEMSCLREGLIFSPQTQMKRGKALENQCEDKNMSKILRASKKFAYSPQAGVAMSQRFNMRRKKKSVWFSYQSATCSFLSF